LNKTHKTIISHLRAQAVMIKDSGVGGEIRVCGYGRSLSPAHSQFYSYSYLFVSFLHRDWLSLTCVKVVHLRYLHFIDSETLPSTCYVLSDESNTPFYSTSTGNKTNF